MNQSAMLAAFVEQCDVDVVMLAGRFTLVDRHAAADLLPIARERHLECGSTIGATDSATSVQERRSWSLVAR